MTLDWMPDADLLRAYCVHFGATTDLFTKEAVAPFTAHHEITGLAQLQAKWVSLLVRWVKDDKNRDSNVRPFVKREAPSRHCKMRWAIIGESFHSKRSRKHTLAAPWPRDPPASTSRNHWCMFGHQLYHPVDKYPHLGADMTVGWECQIHRHRFHVPVLKQRQQLATGQVRFGHVLR